MGLIPDGPPPGPARPGFWRSPVRSTWTTTLIGSALLVAIVIVAATTVLTLVAAVVPTRLATRVAPLEALADA